MDEKTLRKIVSAETKKSVKGEIDPLATYIVKEFAELRKEISGLNDDFSNKVDLLQKSVDAYAKKADGYMQEMLALSHKVDRLERWIMKIAEETGVKLVA